jgi:hypothetical protein
MKKTPLLLLIVTLGLLPGLVSAQYGCNCSTEKELQNFNKTKKLIVQLSGNADYDTALVRAVESGWKLKPYEFADEETVEKLFSNPGLSFLISTCFYDDTYYNSQFVSRRPNNMLVVLNGGNEKYSTQHMLAFSSFGRTLLFSKDRNYREDVKKMMLQNKFRLRDAVAGINEAIEIMAKDVDGPRGSCEYGIKYLNNEFYNKRLGVIENKTLYIKTSDVLRGADKIAKVYPYKFKLVSDAEYKRAIEESRPDVVYVYINHGMWAGGLIVVDAAEHKCVGGIYYAGMYGIDERHIEDIVKEKKKAEKKKK